MFQSVEMRSRRSDEEGSMFFLAVDRSTEFCRPNSSIFLCYQMYQSKSLDENHSRFTDQWNQNIETCQTWKYCGNVWFPGRLPLSDLDCRIRLVQWDENYIYIVMEYCAGGDMSHFIRSRQQLSEARARPFVQQIGSMRTSRDERESAVSL